MSGLAGPDQMRTNRPEEMFCRPSPEGWPASPMLQRRGGGLVSMPGCRPSGRMAWLVMLAAGEWFRTTVSCCSRTRSAD